jgi:hypothetical protein
MLPLPYLATTAAAMAPQQQGFGQTLGCRDRAEALLDFGTAARVQNRHGGDREEE